MWLVDSSKFIEWMRRGESPIRILRPFLVAGQLRTCGIVPVEVLRGVVKPAVRDEMAALFDAIPEVPLSPDIWKRTADLAWTLDRKGMVLPVSDLLIACCALQAQARVVTVDPHFDSIPGLQVRRDLPDLASDSVPFPQTANSYCPAPRFRVLQAPRV
jgi:predicted nucleic acid-binding protein